jgi:hypothetical protein
VHRNKNIKVNEIHVYAVMALQKMSIDLVL